MSTPVTLQPSCVRARLRKGKRDWNPAAAGGVAAGRGLAKAVGGAAAHRGGSDGRDVVGGGCMPLLVRAPATNDHPWSIHGGFIRQVRPTSCCCYYCRYCVVVSPPVASASMGFDGYLFVLIATLGDRCVGRGARLRGVALNLKHSGGATRRRRRRRRDVKLARESDYV